MKKMTFLLSVFFLIVVNAATSENSMVTVEAKFVKRVSENYFHVSANGSDHINVRITPKKGWRIANSKTKAVSISVEEAHEVKVISEMWEDEEIIRVETCYYKGMMTDEHIKKPTIGINQFPGVDGFCCYYARHENDTKRITSYARVDLIEEGVHRKTYKWQPCECGQIRNPSVEIVMDAMTPSAYKWSMLCGSNFAANNTLVGDYDSGLYELSSSVESTDLPECCLCSAMTNTAFTIAKVSTEAKIEWPGDIRRTVFGVGEEFVINVSPDDLNFVVETGLNDTIDGKCCDVQITSLESGGFNVSFQDKQSVSIPIEVRCPTEVQVSATPTGLGPWAVGTVASGMNIPLRLDSTDVSFENVFLRELDANMSNPAGSFVDLQTDEAFLHMQSTHVWGVEIWNKLSEPDVAAISLGLNYSITGSFEWNIPWQWKIGYVMKYYPLKTYTQRFQITKDGTAIVSKFGYSARRAKTDVNVTIE